MKKFLTITVILMAVLLCSATIVNAATTDELVAYISKTFTIAGKEVKLSDADLVKAKRYLAENPVSEADADKVIAKIDEAVAYLNKVGVSDLTKLTKTQKEELLKIAQDAASIVGATISYDATNKVISIYKDGKVYDTVSLESYKFVQTGSNATMYVVIALVAVIAIATVAGYRKVKNA